MAKLKNADKHLHLIQMNTIFIVFDSSMPFNYEIFNFKTKFETKYFICILVIFQQILNVYSFLLLIISSL